METIHAPSPESHVQQPLNDQYLVHMPEGMPQIPGGNFVIEKQDIQVPPYGAVAPQSIDSERFGMTPTGDLEQSVFITQNQLETPADMVALQRPYNEIDNARIENAGIPNEIVVGLGAIALTGSIIAALRYRHGLESVARRTVQKMDNKNHKYRSMHGASTARTELPTKNELATMTAAEKQRRERSLLNDPNDILTYPERIKSKRAYKKEIKKQQAESDARIVAKGYRSTANREGMTKARKNGQALQNTFSRKSPYEKELSKWERRATRTTNPNLTQISTSKKARKADKKYHRAVQQPVLSRWRAFRRRRAARRIP